jgi:tetratricopeptide (TPR) repeat protein
VKPLPDIIKDETFTLDDKQDRRAVPISDIRKTNLHKTIPLEGNKHICFKIKQRKIKQKNKNEEETKNRSFVQNTAQRQLPDAFMVKQRWFIGGGRSDMCYFNIKIVKPNRGFKYVEPVHEYIQEPFGCITHRITDGVEIYQDRVADNDGKTKSRWENDISILTTVLQEKPDDARTQYYLAQTYECLENKEEAFRYYKMRSQNPNGFFEERFLSMIRCGNLKPGYDSVGWFLRAYDFLNRAEPLIELARIFRNKNHFQLAFTFAKMACALQLPEQTLLWAYDKTYNHDRWQELAISAYYVQQFVEGEEACKKALQSQYDKELNAKNLEFYILQKKTECTGGLQKP